MLNVQLAKTFKAAQLVATQSKDWVAIETEYGDRVLDNTSSNVVLSLNHHGDLQENLPPAMAFKSIPTLTRYDNFIISHIDLDVLFGILWTAGWLKKTRVTTSLSEIVAHADLEGFHKVADLFATETYSQDIIQRYYAIGYLVNTWVINDNGLDQKDISKEVHKLLLRIKDIILDGPTPELIKKTEEWFIAQEQIASSYLQTIVNICDDIKLFIFRAPFGLTTAYQIKKIHASLIIQYHEQSKSITLSCIDNQTAQRFFGDTGVIEPLQNFFGKDSGGKKAIGGTPRGVTIQPEMLPAFQEYLQREYFNIPTIIKLKKD